MGEVSHKHAGRLKQMICMLLLMINLAVFQGVAGFDFVNFDDIQYVTQNPHVLSGLSLEGVKWAFTTGHAGNWHPLTWLSHMADVQLFGLNAGLHHLVNLLLHMANTVMLFLFLERITGALWRSALVAAFFAVHPLHVESVAWISERKDVLSTLFWILGLRAYAGYAERPGAGRYAAVVLLLMLGLMCKPMLVTLPFVFLLMDYWPLGRFRLTTIGVKETVGVQSRGTLFLLVEKIPFFALSALSSILTYLVQEKAGLVVASDTYPLGLRLANALVSYVKYIGKMIWPDRLAVYYVHPDTIPLWEPLGAGICVLILSYFFLIRAGKHAYLAVGWLWYIGTLVPVIGLVHVGGQAMADRYTYIPMIGLFILIVWGMHDVLGQRKKWRVVLAAAAAVLLVSFGLRAKMQAGFWKDSLSLWAHTLEATDRNHVAQNMLGGALALLGRSQEAMNHFSESLRIRPDYEKAHYYLGLALTEQGRYDEAATHLTKALGKDCDFPDLVYDKLGMVRLLQGRAEEAREHFLTAIRLNPLQVQAHVDLGVALEQQGRNAEAMSRYSRALELDPANTPARFRLARILYDQGRIQEAAAHYARALEAHPDLAEAHYNMGVVLNRLGKHREAAERFSTAVRLKPDYLEARNNLALSLAQQGRYREALIHLHAVLRVQPENEMAGRNLDFCLQALGMPGAR